MYQKKYQQMWGGNLFHNKHFTLCMNCTLYTRLHLYFHLLPGDFFQGNTSEDIDQEIEDINTNPTNNSGAPGNNKTNTSLECDFEQDHLCGYFDASNDSSRWVQINDDSNTGKCN